VLLISTKICPQSTS